MAETLARRIKRRFDALQSERHNWEKTWHDVAELVLSRKDDFVVKQPSGRVRTTKVFDTTASRAAELLASSISGTLTNPSEPWFSLRFRDRERNDNAEAKAWLNQVADLIMQEINRPHAAFATNINEFYLDLVVFGTAAFYVGWNDEAECLDFRSIFLNEIYIDGDDRGRIDTVYRVYKANAKRLAKQFGEEALPEELREELHADRADKKYRVIHALYLNDDYNPELITAGKNYPVKSVYLLEEREHVLSEGGFEDMPILVARWTKSSCEVYGRSPAIATLPDIKTLQTMQRQFLEGVEFATKPPLFVRDQGGMLPRDFFPGQIIPTEEIPVAVNVRGANLGDTVTAIQMAQARVRDAFYIDQLQLTGGPQMTATEVIQRTDDRRRSMAHVLGRLEQELLSPLISRVFGLLIRRGLIPLPDSARLPEDIPEMTVEYVSPMAQAQKRETAQSVLLAVQAAGAVSQTVKSTGSIVVDGEIAERKVIEAYGLEEIARSEEDVRNILQAQEQMLQAQAQAASQVQDLQNAQTVADIGKTAQEAENLRGNAK